MLLFPGVVSATSVTSYTTNTSSVPKYSKFEATFIIDKQYPEGSFLPYYYYDPLDTPQSYPGRNSPYGVDGISIDVNFTSPSGKTLKLPAFYFQDFVRSGDTMTPTTNYSWKVRFAPEEVGTYTYFLTVLDKSGSTRYPASGTLQFTSTQSQSKGFIKVSPRDSRFLEFSNGVSFIPNSAGRQWMRPGRSTSYENAFRDFKTYGINFTRVWDQNDGYGLTVEGHFDAYKYPDDFGLGGKDDIARAVPKGTQMNQRGNYEEDVIIQAAEQNGVYIQLCAHGDPYWIWDASVYNEGWNDNIVPFDNLQHINYWKRNFRYRVARWGYSTAIMAWEAWNEHGNMGTGDSAYRFYQTYGAYQAQTDPYKHLRTTSQGSQSWSPVLWTSSAFDIANYHDYMMISRYGTDLTYDAANFVYRFAQCLRSSNVGSCGLGIGGTWSGPMKPVVWGELDTGTTTWNQSNPQPKATHAMRWAGLFSPIGTTGIDWYWDAQSSQFIQQKYSDAKVAANFFSDIDYAGKNFSYFSTSDVAINSTQLSASNSNMRVLAMKASNNQESYAWVQNKADQMWNQSTNTTPLSANFSIPGMVNGSYSVEQWDTYSGAINTSSLLVTNGTATISVSNLTRDFAYKIRSTALPSSPPSSKPADANNDNIVDGRDYIVWLNNFGTTHTSGNARGDYNNDSIVDGRDYIVWLNNFGR